MVVVITNCLFEQGIRIQTFIWTINNSSAMTHRWTHFNGFCFQNSNCSVYISSVEASIQIGFFKIYPRTCILKSNEYTSVVHRYFQWMVPLDHVFLFTIIDFLSLPTPHSLFLSQLLLDFDEFLAEIWVVQVGSFSSKTASKVVYQLALASSFFSNNFSFEPQHYLEDKPPLPWSISRNCRGCSYFNVV